MTNDQILVWILSTGVTVMGAVIAAYISLIKSTANISERVKVLEVMFDTIGRKAARALHSPHDPYGLDPLLDKYLDRHYELSNPEWNELLERCKGTEKRDDVSTEQKFFAGMLEAVCMNKLFIDPPLRTKATAIKSKP